ncbi:DsbE family thiol:disulfide interchange protein [Oceanomicrobium pacificus]|uniref:DsbE family thiol:disulfide interchange protein n=1 Tax=Oceanomicrobium pacificus TaxID=2692916 RepID=A0A6B0TS43_9RHOB|nr:DsbE family thiol:disulfide interchange protein [Oceanomicrobium pacificus]MXU65549.1 DsbE family thiol:disulfide interchange protein [Oceanomicrobium pacificus]
MSDTPAPKRRFNWLLLLPPLIFIALTGAFIVSLNRDNPDELPSALAGRQAPALNLTEIAPGLVPPTDADITAPGAKLVNFWASWCGPCRAEHPMLEELADMGLPIIGVNYKDQPQNAVAFLEELGNPYTKTGADAGRNGINWGIYGVPETFVIDGSGKILMRHPGPITRSVLDARILPALAEAGWVSPTTDSLPAQTSGTGSSAPE